jgi:succinyl-CoA synthetase beta subunit
VSLSSIFLNLYTLFVELDGELAEINPLVETYGERFFAVDARLSIDDNALFRHKEFREILFQGDRGNLTPLELKARKEGLVYVQLNGSIGVIGNGAGLTMATIDVIRLRGGEPSAFLDLGGGASSDRVSNALKIVFSDKRVNVVLINILGGITRCDDVAKGIVNFKEEKGFEKPLVVRLIGTNEKEGRQILEAAGIDIQTSLEEAAERAITMTRGV